MLLHTASRTTSLLAVAFAVAVGLIADPVFAQTITGTATYRERMALPPGVVFEATIEDVSRADAPSSVLASTRITSPGNPPIAFTITYDAAKVLPDRRYVVRARIRLGDQLMFTSDTATPVITRGSPTSVSLLLRRVGGTQAGPGPVTPGSQPSPPVANVLQGTKWQLVRFQGSDGKTLTPDDRGKYTIEFDAEGRLNARVDCNRGRGTWKSNGPQLEFGPLALTRATCPPGSLHDRIVKQWTYIRSYVIKDGHLFLALMADGGIYEFEPLETAAAQTAAPQTAKPQTPPRP
jgi:uncharacterized lipoprotein YbaY/heat shock protein HslJ